MKIRLLSMAGALIAMSMFSCNEDKLPEGPEFALSYDGPNETAPFLNGGTYQVAVRFPASMMQMYDGRTLAEVTLFIYDLPQSAEIRIYGQGTIESPGPLLYSESVLRELKDDQWNYHQLTTPVSISGEDLWISFRFSHNFPAQTIGCDPGPAQPDGDWIFASSDNQWSTFRQRSGADINWNIRGGIR